MARRALKDEDKYTVTAMNTKLQEGTSCLVGTEINQVTLQGHNSSTQGQPQGVVCYRCYEPGHYASQCPLQGNGIRVPRAPNYSYNMQQLKTAPGIPQGRATNFVCYYCGGRNHYARDCQKKLRDEQMNRSRGRRQYSPRDSGNSSGYHPNQHQARQYSYGIDGISGSSGQPGGLSNFRAPIEDKAYLAYSAAVDRQANRNFPIGSAPGKTNEAVGGRLGPEAGLGFEQYNDPWSPGKLIGQSQAEAPQTKTHSTIPKN